VNSLVSLFFVVSMFFSEFNSMRYFSESLGENVSITSLLSSNAKLEKLNDELQLSIVGLALSPHNSSGLGNLCPKASEGCISSCVLRYAGRAAMPTTQRAARNRTALFFDNRELFYNLLKIELSQAKTIANAKAQKLAFRANVASDLPIEKLCPDVLGIADYNYDYSAVHARVMRSFHWELNYQLTYSVKETTTATQARLVLDYGGNVAIVVNSRYNPQHKKFGLLPNWVEISGKEFQVVDGDKHDVRRAEFDGRGVVVMLRAKGNNAAKLHARKLGFAKTLPSWFDDHHSDKLEIAERKGVVLDFA
jgi:hypothetical protein